MGRRQTTVSMYEVLSFLRDANLAVYMLNFGDIVSDTHDGMRGEWRFDIMLDVKTYSVPNWLDVGGHRLPVIVSGRKLACWYSGEIGHLSAVCPGKKAPKKIDQNPGTLPPVLTKCGGPPKLCKRLGHDCYLQGPRVGRSHENVGGSQRGHRHNINQ